MIRRMHVNCKGRYNNNFLKKWSKKLFMLVFGSNLFLFFVIAYYIVGLGRS